MGADAGATTSVVGGVARSLGRLVDTVLSTGDSIGATAASTARVARRTAVQLTRPSAIRGLALEAGWFAVHTMTYPWGIVAERLRSSGPYDHFRTEDLPPVQRGLLVSDVRAAGTPILLVHGIVDNRSVFAVLARALRRRGFGTVYGINYSVLTAVVGDVRRAARDLGREVERICELTGADRVHVVGHSLGGLVARYYVQRLGGDDRVDTLVTLGTPHGGTLAAYLLPTPLIRQLRPGSDLIDELAAPAPGCRTRFLAVWSELDQLLVPRRTGRIDHPDLDAANHDVPDTGHLSLPVEPRIVHLVATTLANVERHAQGAPRSATG